MKKCSIQNGVKVCKEENNKLFFIILGILAAVIILFLLFYKPSKASENPMSITNTTSSSGGGGGGGGGNYNPGQSSCQQLAANSGYTYYKTPISTQMGCNVLAFSDCNNRGLAFANQFWNSNIACCMWNCKEKGGNNDGDEETCTDSDGGIKPFDYGYVDDDTTQTSYVDSCIQETFSRYLKEQYCENGVRKETTIDCWATYGAICGNGACHLPACENIINPNSQSDCDKGQPCQNTGEETYCKFIPAMTGAPSRCVCTIDPSTINSCTRACWFAGLGEGYCYTGQLSKNPCGTNTYSQAGSAFCPRPEMGAPTCCCR